jgi:hypothetical protein
MRHAICTRGWFIGESHHANHGVNDCILRLLETDKISRAKARELLEYADPALRGRDEEPPAAPWSELQWGTP